MKDYTQVERDNAALTIREYAFGQMNMLRMLGDEDAANNLQEAINMAIVALRGLEWVRTVDRLPTAEDAGIDGEVVFCYRDEWDCFNRLEKWDEINPQKHTYWHKMLKAPEVEG